MKRREFIILSSVGAASASLLSACGHPEEKLIPALIPDEEYVPGIDYWKASTCGMCPAGCGIIVRTREHKANKIEGNPLHPVNRGALCARGQAGLQVLYNPDRIKGPMKRAGERGEGKWEEISWDEAIKTLADKLREIKVQGGADSVVFATNDSKGVTGLVAQLFMSNYGSKSLVSDDEFNEDWAHLTYALSYGLSRDSRTIPTFDIENARYLLSFGARFLETWQSPVMYSLAYGEFRRTTGKTRGKFVQVEPRMSMTGANADEWLPAAVGTEALVALSIAQVIIREGLVKDVPMPGLLHSIRPLGPWYDTLGGPVATPDSARKHLESYTPEATQNITGIPAEKIIRIAREFATSQPSLAIGGGTFEIGRGHHTAVDRGLEQTMAIHYLNLLVGNLNEPGGVQLNESFDALESLRKAGQSRWMPMEGDAIAGRDVKVLLVHSSNPVHKAPRTADQIKTIPFVVSFSSFIDDTAELADMILPDHSYLESWDIRPALPVPPRRVATLTRPVVAPQLNTRQTADVLLTLARELGQAIPFESGEEIAKKAASGLSAVGLNSAEAAEGFWSTLVERGVWVGEARDKTKAPNPTLADWPGDDAFGVIRTFELRHVNDDDYPLTLLTYEHATLGLGNRANLPLLQELPDSMTSAMWGSWVEINPSTARDLGISDGDLVEVRTTEGAVTVPAILYPAIRPEVIAIPYGQGHTVHGKHPHGMGANASLLNPAASNPGECSATIRAKVTKLAGNATLIRFGTDLWQELEKKR